MTAEEVETASPPVRVSVVIPHYNDAAHLEETVSSVREREPVEVIVVDDGSTDADVGEVLDRVATRGVRVVRAPHRGVSAAVNRGAAEANTPYIFLLGSDDLLEPGALAALADLLDANPALGFAYGDYTYFGARTGTVRTYEWEPWRVYYTNCWTGVFMVRRDLFVRLGGLPEGTFYEDWGFFMTLAQDSVEGRRLPTVTFHYRQAVAGRRRQSHEHRYKQEVRALRSAHPGLVERHRAMRRASGSPLAARFGWPLAFAVRERLPVEVGNRVFAALALARRLPVRRRTQ